jgi:hypothetical protein
MGQNLVVPACSPGIRTSKPIPRSDPAERRRGRTCCRHRLDHLGTIRCRLNSRATQRSVQDQNDPGIFHSNELPEVAMASRYPPLEHFLIF